MPRVMKIEDVFINKLVWLKVDKDEYEETRKLYEKSLKTNLKIEPEDDIPLGHTWSDIGGVYNSIDDYSTAIEKYKKVTRSQRKECLRMSKHSQSYSTPVLTSALFDANNIMNLNCN